MDLKRKGGLLVVYPKCSCTQPRSQGSLLPALRSEPWERGWVAVTCERWLFKREVLIMGVWLEKFTCFEQVVAYGRWSDIEVWLQYFVCSSYLPCIWQSHGRCLTTSNHAYLFASFKIIIIKKFCEQITYWSAHRKTSTRQFRIKIKWSEEEENRYN